MGWSVLESLSRSALYGHWAPLQKQETKRGGVGGGASVVASPMPKSVPFGGREYQMLME